MSCLFGFDVGTKIVGVAVGNRLTGTARALAAIPVRDGQPDWQALDTLRREWLPAELVVGLPLDNEGKEQPMTKTARRFAESIGARYALPVAFADERMSSQEAARRFAAGRAAGTRKRSDAKSIDAEAAAVILESYLVS
ncbi:MULTISPECIES: Holliday junction resolvase RuvX [unclassified Luteibacter]|uniref:Holliday junction resolvase RuvX n=1 Tax=unclassified Luteibacter TaxID=2620188 RepID=UPI0008BC2520|nr:MULTISPECIES: Holliday junction resolvase RuvX [unclassified Luteibacter]MDR6936568.1 putative Holliday junction resolvase [Luteibacter sp. 3190]SEO65836.1 putative holliday junction resolvase [Luteibacter sp. UNC138MFCol5.1]SEV84316.1 putative holliday junction resolvase [Luteibacter sp. 329MFSha]